MPRRTLRHASLALVIGAFSPVPVLSVQAQVSPDAEALQRAAVAASDTVDVPVPTGEENADRTNVQAAFDAVQPGGTVLFAPGTYLLGAGASLTVPDVTVLGHPDGTILRGCDPDAFAVEYSEVASVVFGCTGLYVQAERQTIRGLTFEYTWHGIVVGPYPTTEEEGAALQASGELPAAYPAGGQRIERNTFRATPNGLRVLGTGEELSVVRDNDFIDVFHAIGIYGAPLHFLDNRVTVSEPGRVPFSRHPGSAIIVSPGQTDCAGHVVAGNRIEGYPDPIYVLVRRGETCHGVEIRDNTIHAARVKIPEAWGGYTPTDGDWTMVGAPITLMNRTEPTPGVPEADTQGVLEEILVEGNHIVGAEGVGILIQGVSRSRIAGNTIAAIQRRTPFPGITWDGFEQGWEAANGSGIWLSPGSDGNEIVDNTFEGIAASAVVIEGDSNRVELQNADDAVRDVGTGNRVTRAGGVPRESGAPVGEVLQAAPAQEWTDPSLHEIRYVTVAPDVRLEVLDWGGDGLPLVFLAGANFNAHPFDDFAPRFTGTHRVLGITRRGHGASSWPDWGYDLPTLVEDIRLVLDSLEIARAILAGHSMAGSEMTLFATESPDRVAGLIYIDAGHDPTDIARLGVPELCSFSPALLEAMERTFENPELVRRTQWHTDENGARRPFASAAAVARIDEGLPSPDYSGVRAPALGIYYVPERTEDVFMRVVEQPTACVAAFHRYIHDGMAAFADGVEQATVTAMSDTNHNIHLASPAALEAFMRRWLDSHVAPEGDSR